MDERGRNIICVRTVPSPLILFAYSFFYFRNSETNVTVIGILVRLCAKQNNFWRQYAHLQKEIYLASSYKINFFLDCPSPTLFDNFLARPCFKGYLVWLLQECYRIALFSQDCCKITAVWGRLLSCKKKAKVWQENLLFKESNQRWTLTTNLICFLPSWTINNKNYIKRCMLKNVQVKWIKTK